MTSNDILLTPFELGNLKLRNRIVSTSHEPAYCEGGLPQERYRSYHVEKARGGVGLTMIGGSAVVSPDSPASFGNIDMSTDEVIPHLAKLADEVHEAGAAVTIQLTHLGARTSNYTGEWLPLVSASAYREPAHRAFSKEAEDFDLERITADFAAAAVRAEESGLDGIELQHYGHLLDSFVSPWINHRNDSYGGKNGAGFVREVIKAIRDSVSPDFLVGIRMSMDEMRDDGLGPAETLPLLESYIDAGVGFLSLIQGTIESDRALAQTIPGMGTPTAPFLNLCRDIRSQLSIPVMHAARISDVSTARHALESGAVDLVGLTRPQLADPHLVAKLSARREDDIRPCVGANACLDAIYVSGSAHCVHNPATGREQYLPHQITASSRSQRVVIIGAGPAGLEAARVCALRGHTVTVLEAAAAHGGQVAVAARSRRRRDLIGIVDWRRAQAEKHGVELRFNMAAEAADVLALEPDVVIVATGGVPNTLGFTAKRLWDVEDVLLSDSPLDGTAIVYDDNGQHPAFDAVEHLIARGSRVIYATPEKAPGIDIGAMNYPAYFEAFDKAGVEFMLNARMIDLRDLGQGVRAVFVNVYSDRKEELCVERVVVDHGTLPNDDLYFDLKQNSANRGFVAPNALIRPLQGGAALDPGETYALARIGDAVSSRNIHAALLDALRIGLLV